MTVARLRLANPADEAKLLSAIIETISSGTDLDELVQGVAALVTNTTATDVCFVHLLEADGRRLRLRGATPPFDALAGQVELAVGEGVSGWVAAHGEPVVITDDKRADPRYRYIPALRGEDFTSMASVPIITPTGHLVGVLNVHTRAVRHFSAADIELLASVAGLMAGAIESARLHRRLAEREAALERFAERMVELQESERRRLGGEIHDGISQRIVSLSFHLSAAADALPADPARAGEQIGRARDLARAALEETRSAIAGLRPPVLDDLGLAASLQSLAHEFPGLPVEVDVAPMRLADHLETAVYRIAQEALQNVVKHAGARHATLRLWVEDGSVVLSVDDDGSGFELEPAIARGPSGPVGYGLSGMRERAELLGGQLDIASGPGRGTALRLALPFSAAGPPPPG